LYGSVAGVAALLVLIWFGFSIISKPATCFDGARNQGEEGVDCGGPCARICSVNTRNLVVEWQRVFLTGQNTYTAIAYIQNPNAALGAGAYNVPYAFRLYDASGVLIVEKDGAIDIPPQQTIPLVEPIINVGNRTVGQSDFAFSKSSIVWTKIPSASLPDVRIVGQQLSPDGSHLTAVIVNDGSDPIRSLAVAAVLYDAQGNAQGASRSVIGPIPAGASQRVDFTWNPGVPNVVQAALTPIFSLPPAPSAQ